MSPAPTVHVVGDEKAVRQAVAALFTLGLEVSCWNSGAQFLAGPIPEPEDMILLDLDIAGMRAFDVIERLRAWDVMTPVIAIAGRDERRPESELIAAGAVWVLRMPFGGDELQRALAIAQASAMRLRRAMGEGRRAHR
jgi:FixJ family two-component response regulator